MATIAGFAVLAATAACSDGGSSTSTGTPPTGPKCGNAVVETDEACDDGNTVSGDGCEADCSFSCDNTSPETGDAKCDDGNACNGAETCGDTHACTKGTNADDGSSCGTAKICIAGACADDICGDGFVSTDEECDDANMTNGDGCDACKFSCASNDPTRDCSGLDPCTATSCDDATHTCGNAIADGSVCALASVCDNGTCTAVSCGDNIVQLGEACDDGNNVDGDGCQADCTLPLSGVCGNGVRDAGEQCDDSNTTNIDGCDAKCRFEQVQRATWLALQFGTEAPFCPDNRLGGAISTLAQGQIQTALDDGIKNGSITIMFKTLGLADPSGATDDPAVEIGVLSGSAIKPPGVMYDGTADLDWWYTTNALSIDANRDPLDKLAGFISGNTLTAGPGNLSLGISFVGAPALLKLSNARLTASVGAASKPLASGGTTPGHRAQENLDPALMSYASTGQPNDAGAGKLCGNVSAVSLDQVPAPAPLLSGMLACGQGYTALNSLLDVLVSGCTVFGVVNVITASQPDQADPSTPVAGAGAPYKFTVNAAKAVTGCQDKNNQVVDLNTCLNAAAYSSFFKVATGRVIAK